MTDAVSDTGPLLHLREINHLSDLRIFGALATSELVLAECREYGLPFTDSELLPVPVTIVQVPSAVREAILRNAVPFILHPADAEVVAVWQERRSWPVLADDLALRRYLEGQSAVVVGTVGVLVRAYNENLIPRAALEQAIEDLFERSTLRLSKAFRSYLRKLIAELP